MEGNSNFSISGISLPVLVFERVTAGAELNGSEGADVSFDEKFADHADEPNGSKVEDEDTEALDEKYFVNKFVKFSEY